MLGQFWDVAAVFDHRLLHLPQNLLLAGNAVFGSPIIGNLTYRSFATLHFASRHLSGIDQCLEAVMWHRSTVAVHAVPQGGALKSVLTAIFVILFFLGGFSGFGTRHGRLSADH
jgi:hypothetical protein